MDFVLDAPGLIENLVMCTAHDCSQVRSAAHEVLTTTAQEDTVATLAFRVLDLLETVADWRGRVKAIEWINHLVAGRLKEHQRGGGTGEPLEQQAKGARQRRERAVRAAGRRRGSRARSRFRRSRRGRRARARRVASSASMLEARRRANRGVSGRQGRRAGSRRGASASSCRVGHPRRGR